MLEWLQAMWRRLLRRDRGAVPHALPAREAGTAEGLVPVPFAPTKCTVTSLIPGLTRRHADRRQCNSLIAAAAAADIGRTCATMMPDLGEVFRLEYTAKATVNLSAGTYSRVPGSILIRDGQRIVEHARLVPAYSITRLTNADGILRELASFLRDHLDGALPVLHETLGLPLRDCSYQSLKEWLRDGQRKSGLFQALSEAEATSGDVRRMLQSLCEAKCTVEFRRALSTPAPLSSPR